MKCPDCLTVCEDAFLFCPYCGFKFSPGFKDLLRDFISLKDENEKLKSSLNQINNYQLVMDEFHKEIEELLVLRDELLSNSSAVNGCKLEAFDVSINMTVFEENYSWWKTGKITSNDFIQKLGLSPMNFYRFVSVYELNSRTTQARVNKASNGGYAGGRPPYGYKAMNGYLIIDNLESLVVREIFTLRQNGSTLEQIANVLNGRGFSTRKGNPWTFGTIRTILDNEKLYCGFYKYGNNEWVKGVHESILKTTE